MRTTHRARAGLAAGAAGALALAGCASGGAAGSDDQTVQIGFFGYAASNSYAQGIFAGVEDKAEELGANATFVDGNFEGPTQVQQINDAVTSQQYDVIIITANDNLAVQEPLQKAVEAGITVVVSSTPVGPDFTSIEPQVDGAISVVYSPIANGEDLADLGAQACEEVGDECKVAYMEGDPSLPLDNARTEAVVGGLEAADGVTVLPTVTGGYTQDEGRTAYQGITQANPDVDVIIASTQALAGAWLAGGEDTDIRFIGNGGPQSAVDRVVNGEWFAIWVIDSHETGGAAAEFGVLHHQGEEVPMTTDERELSPNNAIGTQEALSELGFESSYEE